MVAAWASGFVTNVMLADPAMGWLGDGDVAMTPNSAPTLHVHVKSSYLTARNYAHLTQLPPTEPGVHGCDARSIDNDRP